MPHSLQNFRVRGIVKLTFWAMYSHFFPLYWTAKGYQGIREVSNGHQARPRSGSSYPCFRIFYSGSSSRQMLPRRCCVPVAKYLSRFSFYEGNDSKIVTLWPFLARRLPATRPPMPGPIMAIVLFVFPLSLSGGRLSRNRGGVK